MLAYVTLARRAASTGNAQAIKATCSGLASQVAKVKTLEPAPDTELRTDISAAATSYGQAAQACLHASLDQALTAFGKGDIWGQRALNRIHQLAGTH